jgi:hypothetical protein
MYEQGHSHTSGSKSGGIRRGWYGDLRRGNNKATKRVSDADAPQPIQHDDDRQEHGNGLQSGNTDHLRDAVGRAPEK